MTGVVVYLEDKKVTIESELETSSQLHLRSSVWERPFQVANYLRRKSTRPSDIKAFVLDMNMNVKDLTEIKMSRIDTAGGEAVGLSFAEAYLRREGSPYRETPLGFLTGFEVQPKIEARIHALNQSCAPAVLLRKGVDLAGFESFLRRAMQISDSGEAKALPDAESIRQEDFQEGIRIASEMLSEIGLDEHEVSMAFGFRPRASEHVTLVHQARGGMLNVDIEDRTELIIDFYSRLRAIFGDNVSAQTEWLHAGQDLLEGRTPIETLRRGRLYELARLSEILRRVTG